MFLLKLALPFFCIASLALAGGLFGRIKACFNAYRSNPVADKFYAGPFGPRKAEIQKESNPFIRQSAQTIVHYMELYDGATEVGAFGTGLSWKAVGVAEETGADGKKTYRVVGYGNFQHFLPYQGRLVQIDVATTIRDDVFVNRTQLDSLPRDVRDNVVKSIELALNHSTRLFSTDELAELQAKGSLPPLTQ